MRKFMIEMDETSHQFQYLLSAADDEGVGVEDVIADIIQMAVEVDCPDPWPSLRVVVDNTGK